MEILKRHVINNRHYRTNKIINVKGFVLHSVGYPQPDPQVFVKNWNTTTNKYLTQIVVGTDMAIEVLPCMQIKGKAVFCWHVGDANGYTIGVEMTEPSTIKYTNGANWVDLNPAKTKEHVMATYKNAVDIFAQLCKFHDRDPLADGVILSHSECYKRGIGTNHGDVEHIWNKFGLTMDQFRKDVSIAMGIDNEVEAPSKVSNIKSGDIVKISADATYYNGGSIPSWVTNQNWVVSEVNGDRAIIDKNTSDTNSINSPINIKFLSLVESKFEPFIVKVSKSNVNMRTGPGTNNPSIGYIPTGAYTIVEVNGNWGRLKSQQTYNGKLVDAWISLNYAKRV